MLDGGRDSAKFFSSKGVVFERPEGADFVRSVIAYWLSVMRPALCSFSPTTSLPQSPILAALLSQGARLFECVSSAQTTLSLISFLRFLPLMLIAVQLPRRRCSTRGWPKSSSLSPTHCLNPLEPDMMPAAVSCLAFPRFGFVVIMLLFSLGASHLHSGCLFSPTGLFTGSASDFCGHWPGRNSVL